MQRYLIHLICAARPNFIKVAPLYRALVKEHNYDVKIIHTGQHYDALMSTIFFEQLGLPPPDHNLSVGSGTHAEQTGHTMIAYESLCKETRPDICVVFGDVNATLACSLAAKKMNIPIAHVESGLRSFDMSMPEEINRILVDRISDLHFTPSLEGSNNLIKEGIKNEQIKFVGNIMIDALEMMKDDILKSNIVQNLNLKEKSYAVLTIHRPSNVDDLNSLINLLNILIQTKDIHIIFPIHPRTRAALKDSLQNMNLLNISIIDPLAYLDFMKLIMHAKYVLTDSGGIQEETSYLGIPCLTLRNNTERPITITQGTNQLVNLENLLDIISSIKHEHKVTSIPLWDGNTAERIVNHIKNYVEGVL